MQREPAAPAVGPEEAARRVDEGAVLLDVREPDEWHAGHAPNAVHIPLAALAASVSFLWRRRSVALSCSCTTSRSSSTAMSW